MKNVEVIKYAKTAKLAKEYLSLGSHMRFTRPCWWEQNPTFFYQHGNFQPTTIHSKPAKTACE